MSSEVVTISADSALVQAMLRKAPEQTQATIKELLNVSGTVTMGLMRMNAPAGATGDLRRGIRYYFKDSETVAVEPVASYATSVEKGSAPHWVSAKAGTSLWRWATQKGIPVYAVQRSIAKKGTKAHPFMQPTYEQAQPEVQRIFDNGIMALATRLNNG